MKTTIRAVLLDVSEEAQDDVNRMMLKFSSAVRYAFNRLIDFKREEKEISLKIKNITKNVTEEEKKKWQERRVKINKAKGELEKKISERFGFSIRHAKDALQEASEVIKSQEELIKEYYENYKEKAEAVQKIIDKLETQKSEIKNNDSKRENKAGKIEFKIKGLKSKLEKRLKIMNYYKSHIDNVTLPPVIFGGRENYIKRCKNKISNEEWKDLRNNKLLSRGDRTKNGNPNLRIIKDAEECYLEVSLDENTSKSDKKPRYKKIRVKLYLPEKKNKWGAINGQNYKQRVEEYISREDTPAYQVQLIRKKNRKGKMQYYCHITLEEPEAEIKTYSSYELIGIDTNPDGFATTIINKDGCFLSMKNIVNDRLTHARANQRENIIGELATEVTEYALKTGCSLVIEDLKFRQNKDSNKKFNRVRHNFIYRKLLERLEAKCKRVGVDIILVPPEYTSSIGLYKYSQIVGKSIPVHNAAALVIARRGRKKYRKKYLYKESIPKWLRKNVLEKTRKESEYNKLLNKPLKNQWITADMILKAIRKKDNERIKDNREKTANISGSQKNAGEKYWSKVSWWLYKGKSYRKLFEIAK